jgi:thymidylate kinase
MLIAIVGPCGAGKTVLADGLKQRDIYARQIAQEHSFVQDMWQVVTQPDILIYLDASFTTCTTRKQFNWRPQEYERQLHRLAHAREHCSIYVDTDALTIEQVLHEVLDQLHEISS